jgi:16S rRNA C967 or C1407 C5-methylase (RsmB/RsmF family)/NOL1/NOP2/fmu family ribosome biogenesis protein
VASISCLLPHELRNGLPVSLQSQWDDLCQAHQEEAVNSIRSNPKKTFRSTDGLTKVPWCQYGFYLTERPSYVADPLWHAGAYYVQEASSMFLEQAFLQHANFREPKCVLDLCAAPGGKSTLMASILDEDDLLVSNEVIQSRVGVLNENAVKWGSMNHWVCQNDPAQFGRTPDMFNVLLVDAPCSGSGLFRKLPEYQHEWSNQLVHLCAERQKRILHDSLPSLSHNGLLIYMTCSLSQAENEDMLDFLMESFDLSPLKIDQLVEGIVETSSSKGAYGYRLMPHLIQGEGFFLACFRKNDGQAMFRPSKPKIGHAQEGAWNSFLKTEALQLIQKEDDFYAISAAHHAFYQQTQRSYKWIKRGIALGKMIRKDMIPDHELAMYQGVEFQERVELDLKQALMYLKKDTFVLPDTPKGWHLASFQGLPLGWVKNLGNRMNNYYPSTYRILKQNILT